MNLPDFYFLDPSRGKDPKGETRFRRHAAIHFWPGILTLLIVTALVGLGWAKLGADSMRIQRFIEEPVVATTGVVTNITEHKSDDSTTWNMTWTYEVDGVVYAAGPTKVRGSYAASHPIGSAVAVDYLAQDPAEARLSEGQKSPRKELFGLRVLAGILAIIPILGTTMLAYYWKRHERFRANRHLLLGQVIAARRQSDGEGGYSLNLNYQFLSPSGQVIESSACKGTCATAKIPTPGTPVFVLYADEKTYEML